MKAVKLSIGIILLLLSLINISSFTGPLQEGKKISTHMESLVPIASDPNEFISVWDTTKYPGNRPYEVSLPLEGNGTYNFVVYWGDGTSDTITSHDAETHIYPSPGVYTITITGTIVGWRFEHAGDYYKLINVQQWGCLRLGNSGDYFAGCENLVITATDNLNLMGTTNLCNTFFGCSKLGVGYYLNGWDVSRVTAMSGMFFGAYLFNGYINSWNVSSVINMREMFYDASSFNQPLNSWKVSHVITMERMFYEATSFNQPISSWDVSSVTNMQEMFYSFYSGESSFNRPIGDWDVSSVTTMARMFHGASSFNQPLDSWNVSRVTTMERMFNYANSFNRPIGDWNVSRVTNMREMFYDALSFNQPLGNWNVSRVTTMASMFRSATSFNQPLGNWNVSRVTNMGYMFRSATSFNQPLGNWNVSSVTTMERMFQYANSFDQPLGSWNVSRVTNMEYMIYIEYPARLSTSNYENLLFGWSKLTLQMGISFHAGYSKYSYAAVDARQAIITNFAWTIIDGGLDETTLPPGMFTLSSDARTPDTDGSFTLIWTSSARATVYNVYYYSSYITEINWTLTLLADKITDLTLEIIGYLDGTHYFIVVANNTYGNTLSNCFPVVVKLILVDDDGGGGNDNNGKEEETVEILSPTFIGIIITASIIGIGIVIIIMKKSAVLRRVIKKV